MNIRRAVSILLLGVLIVSFSLPALASDAIPEQYREAYKKGFLEGILGKPLTSTEFLFNYLARLSALKVDFSLYMFSVNDDYMLLRNAYLKLKNGVITSAYFSFSPDDLKEDEARAIIAFILAFKYAPGSDGLRMLGGGTYYDLIESDINKMWISTKESPYVIKKYGFYIKDNGDDALLTADLLE